MAIPKKALLIIVTLGLIGAILYVYFQQKALPPVMKATGTIEVTRADAMPKLAGYVTDFQLKAGERVEKGQIIGKVVRTDLEAQLWRDEAALAKAESQLEDLASGAREQERLDLTESVAASRAVYEKAQADYDRYEKLAQAGAISAQQLDTARSALAVALHNKQSLEQKLSLLEAGNRPQTIEAQRLEVERNKAIVKASQTVLDDRIVVSPISGLILTKNFENGEYVNPGAALLTIGDMQDCWVKIYIPSTQLGLVQIGQQAEVRVDSFPDRVFMGTVREISTNAEFTPRQSLTPSERANMVFAVKVAVNNSEGLLKPGMPADVVLP